MKKNLKSKKKILGGLIGRPYLLGCTGLPEPIKLVSWASLKCSGTTARVRRLLPFPFLLRPDQHRRGGISSVPPSRRRCA